MVTLVICCLQYFEGIYFKCWLYFPNCTFKVHNVHSIWAWYRQIVVTANRDVTIYFFCMQLLWPVKAHNKNIITKSLGNSINIYKLYNNLIPLYHSLFCIVFFVKLITFKIWVWGGEGNFWDWAFVYSGPDWTVQKAYIWWRGSQTKETQGIISVLDYLCTILTLSIF